MSEDEIFDVLSHRRRRFTIHAIKHSNANTSELGPLAETIAAWENRTDPARITSDQRKRVYTALQQQHLPMMDKAGVVEFDSNRGTIEPTREIEEVDIYVDVLMGKEIPWSAYYLGLSVLFVLVEVAIWMSIWPFTLVTSIGVGVLLTVFLVASAILHRCYEARIRIGEDTRPPELDKSPE
jgi:hypothetical protein